MERVGDYELKAFFTYVIEVLESWIWKQCAATLAWVECLSRSKS